MRKPYWATSRVLNPTPLRFAAVFSILVLASGGCRTEQGRSSFEMLEPIVAPPAKSDAKGETQATNIVINPIPPSFIGNLTKPVYPPDALAGHAGGCVVFVTITIDPKGIVSDVAPSWQRVNIPSRFSDQFIDAIRSAVRSWRFEPARNVYWENDGSGELRYLSTETISAKTDIKFTFEASGAVR
jgi:hypothetical protein